MRPIAITFSWFVLSYFAVFVLAHIGLYAMSAMSVLRASRTRRSSDLDRAGNSPLTPTVSIVVPAYNEQACIVGSVRSLLDLHYLRREIVIVNDGSSDETLVRLHDAFELVEVPVGSGLPIPTATIEALYMSRTHPELWVVDKLNGGRSDAVNAGINVARGDLIAVTDADSVLEPDSIALVVQPFVDDPGGCLAVGGIVRIANGSTFDGGRLDHVGVSRNPVAAIQVLEYLRGFLGGRVAWARMNALPIVSGAFGVFRRDALVQLGGFSLTTMGEDMEMVVRMHHELRPNMPDARVCFVPEAVCWTEAPERLRDLRGQRVRWHIGLLEVLGRHRAMMLNPRYGLVGMASLPFTLAFEALGPLIEGFGYLVIAVSLLMGWLNVPAALAFVAVSLLCGVLLSVASLLVEEVGFRRYPRKRDLAQLIGWAILENFGYRQIMTWWRVKATVLTVIGRKPGWGTIERSTALDGAADTRPAGAESQAA